MDLEIDRLTEKSAALARLSRVLRDARVLSRSAWDVRERRFELLLERIYYEFGLGGAAEGVREYPSIEVRLTVSPVTSYATDLEKDEGEFGVWEGLVALELTEGSELRLTTTAGTTRLTLASEARLTARDTGVVSNLRTTRDHGAGADLEEIQAVVSARQL